MASVTITDVARRAGVSIKTVSRVLNAEPHVRDVLRERVRRAASELRYRPNLSARRLAGARSYVVGFLLNGLSASVPGRDLHPYLVQAELGVLRACRKAGYHLLVEAFDLGAEDLGAEVERFSGVLDVDGVVLTPPFCDDNAIMDALDKDGIRYARIAPENDDGRGVSVALDEEGAARAMTDHLLDLGHTRIAFVGGPLKHRAPRRRLKGYRDAMAGRAAPSDPSLVVAGLFTFKSGYDAAANLLSLAQPPTAVFAANDLMALGVMAKAEELGRKVPDDLSVAGFDDVPMASMVRPGLTTMHPPVAELACAATEMIIARAARAPGASPLPSPAMSCELIVRGSTAPPPTRR